MAVAGDGNGGTGSASSGFLGLIEGIVNNAVANAGSSSTQNEEPVYWDNVATSPGGGLSEHSRGVVQPTRLSAADQQRKVYSYFTDPNKRVAFATDLYRIGAMNDSRGFTQIGYFSSAAANAIDLYRASGSSMSFTQWLATEADKSGRAAPGLDDGSNGGGRRSGGGGGSVAYNGPTSAYDFTNEFDAETLANDALSRYLGRQATDDEIVAFKKKLNATEAANPTVTTPIGVAAASRAGGVNQQAVARDWAMGQDDYAETQAATTLTGWLTDAVRGAKAERII